MNFVTNNLLSGVMYPSNTWSVWEELRERFNKINGSRTFNLHKETTFSTYGTSSFFVYFTRLEVLWNEFEALVSSPNCDCGKAGNFVHYLQRQKMYEFHMGIDDSYLQTRSHFTNNTFFLT